MTRIPNYLAAIEIGSGRGIEGLMSQTEIAAKLGMTKSHVSQIEQRALRKIRSAIEAEAKAAGETVWEWLEV